MTVGPSFPDHRMECAQPGGGDRRHHLVRMAPQVPVPDVHYLEPLLQLPLLVGIVAGVAHGSVPASRLDPIDDLGIVDVLEVHSGDEVVVVADLDLAPKADSVAVAQDLEPSLVAGFGRAIAGR